MEAIGEERCRRHMSIELGNASSYLGTSMDKCTVCGKRSDQGRRKPKKKTWESETTSAANLGAPGRGC